jgi:tetratricopeptide (TPR) repeat protein
LGGDWLGRDQSFLAEKSVVRDPAGLWKIWFAPSDPDYRPVTTSVQWLQWRVLGEDPLGYHLTNAGLHLLGALLLWRLLRKLGAQGREPFDSAPFDAAQGRQGIQLRSLAAGHERRPTAGVEWLGGLLLIVHPFAVESVARIPELGACLALPLLLLSALAWTEISEFGIRNSKFLLSLTLFILALLSDFSAGLFPAVLLLYAWWKHRRITQTDWRAIEPFVAVLLMFAAVTLCLRSYSTADATTAGLFSRLATAGMGIGSYLLACLVPVNLVPIQPHAWLPLAVLIGLGAAALGWFFSSPAFRGFAFQTRMILFAGVAAVIAAWAGASRSYAGVFTSNETFWSAAADRDPDSSVAQYNQGLVLVGSHRLPEAIDHFAAALRLKPDYAEAQSDLAIALCVEGRPMEAIPHFERAIQLNADSAQIRYNFGLALRAVGRPEEARAQWQAASRLLHGGSADAH